MRATSVATASESSWSTTTPVPDPTAATRSPVSSMVSGRPISERPRGAPAGVVARVDVETMARRRGRRTGRASATGTRPDASPARWRPRPSGAPAIRALYRGTRATRECRLGSCVRRTVPPPQRAPARPGDDELIDRADLGPGPGPDLTAATPRPAVLHLGPAAAAVADGALHHPLRREVLQVAARGHPGRAEPGAHLGRRVASAVAQHQRHLAQRVDAHPLGHGRRLRGGPQDAEHPVDVVLADRCSRSRSAGPGSRRTGRAWCGTPRR